MSDKSESVDRLEAARREKLDRIIEMGVDPYGQRFDGHQHIRDVRPLCPEENGVEGETVRVAGRVMSLRKAGKLAFLDVKDATGRVQFMISRKEISEEQWELFKCLDLGDLIGADGFMRRTNTGEISVWVRQLHLLCKSLAHPPDKFHGAQDTELLLRRRYIDLIYNEGVLDRMLLRTKILSSVRATLNRQEYVEVETPVLHAIAGGAAARPFITHHNALDIPLYLRIALELHLKRLMVGGVERVYEIGRVFRNEGIDATHNPEFTMIEIYQAYGNYETMMDLTEAIVCDAARIVKAQLDNSSPANSESGTESLVLPWGEEGHIDFTPPWERKTYAELLKEIIDVDMHNHEQVLAYAKSNNIKTEGKHIDVVISELFEEFVEDQLQGPVFVCDYPASICPLTKRKTSNPAVAERFELFIDGMELANAYTELNDPKLQEELFLTQLDGQKEEDSMAKMDHDFVRALKVGMPPAGGLGIGIDRLVMLLTNTRSIRDVIYFPLLKPEHQADLEVAET